VSTPTAVAPCFSISRFPASLCIGVNANRPSGSRRIMKLTAPLQKLQTPSKMTIYWSSTAYIRPLLIVALEIGSANRMSPLGHVLPAAIVPPQRRLSEFNWTTDMIFRRAQSHRQLCAQEHSVNRLEKRCRYRREAAASGRYSQAITAPLFSCSISQRLNWRIDTLLISSISIVAYIFSRISFDHIFLHSTQKISAKKMTIFGQKACSTSCP